MIPQATAPWLPGGVIELHDWNVPVDVAARKIVNFVTDANALEVAKAAVVKAAEKYKIDVVVKQYVSIFERTIHGRQDDAQTVA